MRAIELKRSRALAMLLLTMHGLTLVLALSLPLPIFWKLAVAPVLAPSLAAYSVRGEAWRALASSVTAITPLPDSGIEVQTRRRERRAARLQAGSFVTPQLTVLRYRHKDRFFSSHVVILADAVDAEDFRRLRVHLRWRNLS